jgi:tetratricopeptide (TPR) repeat protein
MSAPPWVSRLGHSRSFRLLGTYFAGAWVLLQLAALLREELGLEPWLVPSVLVFLGAGLLVTCAVLWARSHPIVSEGTGELELDRPPSLLRRILESVTPARGILAGAGVFVGLIVVSALIDRDGPEADPPKDRPGGTPGAEADSAAPPADRALRDGDVRFRRADFEGALESYRAALQADSSLALAAYRRLALTPLLPPLPPDSLDRWHAGAERLPDRLPEPHATILRARLGFVEDERGSVQLLERTVAARPRDAEAWYGLGEMHLRRGAPLDAERALARAVTLDSLHGPACVRLLQVQFGEHPAAAENARRIARCLPAVRGGPRETSLRLLGGVVGGGAPRAAALAALDTVPVVHVTEVLGYLSHPALWDAQGEVLVRRRDRPEVGAEEAAFWTALLYQNRLHRGRLEEALRILEDRRLSALDRAELTYAAVNAGLPVPRAAFDRYLGPASVGEGEDFRNFYMGAAAMEEERWDDYATALRRLERDASRFAAVGDQYAFTLASFGGKALRAQVIRSRGTLDGAFTALEDAHARTLHTGPGLNSTIAYWLGELSLERGRPWEALDFFTAAERRSVAAEAIARAYERFGDREAARDFYAWLPVAWRDADPALQPRVEEARRAVARLGGGAP